jgi:uncharacterized peroxidase-related enzyme
MTEFVVHTIDSAPDLSKDILRAAERKFGFVPNLLGELSAAPVALRAYVTLGDLLAQTSFSAVEQQLILAAVSLANSCEYCVAAHSAGLKAAGLAGDELEALRDGRPLKDGKLEALRAFVTTIVQSRGFVKHVELQRFLAAGYTEEQVLETLVGVAMKTLSNYTNHIADTPLDAKFEPFAWQPATA